MVHFKANLQIVALFFAIVAANAQFEYCNQGDWIDDFNDCGKDHQSPIELNSNEISSSDNLSALNFFNYDTLNIPATIQNNGLTVNIQLGKVKDLPYITGGALESPNRYELDSMHYHWGSMDSHGSEHIIDGKPYSMELHMVHRNIKYPTIEEAMNHKDGLAVLGIMYDVVSETSHAKGLVNIINALHEMNPSNYNETISIKNFNLRELIGDLEYFDYYTYSGSLTTPPCSEVVTWHVMDSPVKMSYSQIKAFRALRDQDGARLDNNYRGLKAKGNREVRMYVQESRED